MRLHAITLAIFLGSGPGIAAAAETPPGASNVVAQKPSAALMQALERDLREILPPPHSLRGGGHRVRLQSIELVEWDARHFWTRFGLRYQKTRHFPKYSTSGSAKVRFTFYPGDNGEICISDLHVEEIDLNRVPQWLDKAWLEKKLKGKLPGEVCTK